MSLMSQVKQADKLQSAGAMHSVPAQFTIGDDLPFRAMYVTSGRTGQLIPGAVLNYQLLDKQSRALKAAGQMFLYDAATASFEAVIPASELAVYDPIDNPNGIEPNNQYILHIIILDNGIKTTIAANLTATLDAIVA